MAFAEYFPAPAARAPVVTAMPASAPGPPPVRAPTTAPGAWATVIITAARPAVPLSGTLDGRTALPACVRSRFRLSPRAPARLRPPTFVSLAATAELYCAG